MRSRRKLGLAGRAGRWSAAHRKTAIWGWILFVVLAIVVGARQLISFHPPSAVAVLEMRG